MNIQYLIYIIPLSYGGIQALELIALLSRIAGLKTKYSVLGYSIQQSIYLGTRFLLVLLLPAMGFLVDHQMAKGEFINLMHLCLFIAGLSGVIVLIFRNSFVNFQSRVILAYVRSRSLPKAYVKAFFRSSEYPVANSRSVKMWPMLKHWRLLAMSSIIFWTYSVGSMLTFYTALLFPDYRASISQLSGAVNAFAAVLLAFVVEPLVASEIDDESAEAEEMIVAMFWGRLLAVLVLGHLTLLLLPR